MAEKESNIISAVDAIASIATAASFQFYLDEVGKPKVEYRPFTGLATALLAVGSYYFGMHFMPNKANKGAEKKLIEAISRTTLDVKVDSEGQVATIVNMKPPVAAKEEKTIQPQEPEQNVVVEYRDGNTYYKIQNLNIYLTVDVVHQLNINPKEVINNLKDEVKAELQKIEKKELQLEK
jgi:hypothetical protein